MSLCAKFQLSSWSRSAWKVWGWWRGFQVTTKSNLNEVAFELLWVELRLVLTIDKMIQKVKWFQLRHQNLVRFPDPWNSSLLDIEWDLKSINLIYLLIRIHGVSSLWFWWGWKFQRNHKPYWECSTDPIRSSSHLMRKIDKRNGTELYEEQNKRIFYENRSVQW